MKAVVVPYSIAILIGIIVLVIAVFVFYKSSGSAILTSEQCKGRFLAWCTNCVMANPTWSTQTTLPADLTECLPRAGVVIIPTNCGDAQSSCSMVGVTTTISTTTTLSH